MRALVGFVGCLAMAWIGADPAFANCSSDRAKCQLECRAHSSSMENNEGEQQSPYAVCRSGCADTFEACRQAEADATPYERPVDFPIASARSRRSDYNSATERTRQIVAACRHSGCATALDAVSRTAKPGFAAGVVPPPAEPQVRSPSNGHARKVAPEHQKKTAAVMPLNIAKARIGQLYNEAMAADARGDCAAAEAKIRAMDPIIAQARISLKFDHPTRGAEDVQQEVFHSILVDENCLARRSARDALRPGN